MCAAAAHSAGADLAHARDALQAIPPDLPRDDWVRAGMAAKAAGLSFDDFDAWSAQADNYNAADARDTWRSIKDGKGIGAGTLFHLARNAGWAPAADHPARAPAAPRQQRPPTPARPARPGFSAAEIWSRCIPADDSHGYILAKDGTPQGLRVVPGDDPLRVAGLPMAGALVVPVTPIAGDEPVSLQFIASPDMAVQWKAAGKPGKLNLPGAPVAGVFVVGDLAPGGLAYVVEGIGQAWACWKATGAAAVVAFGWGRVRAVAAELRKRDAAARLVLVPDAGKEDAAEDIAADLGAELVTMPAGSPPNFDANDYAQTEGLDALEILLGTTRAPSHPEPAMPWRVVPLDDLDSAELPPQAWAWQGYIPAGQVTMLAAHGGTGKSTVAAMLTVAVALEEPLFGVPTVGAPVVFFSAEDGADTVRRRLRAVVHAMGVSVAGVAQRVTVLDVTHGAPELAAPMVDASGRQTFGATPTADRLRELLADKPGALLIVDNASDTMGGNENARPEVRAFVRLLASMVRDTGGAVLLLAHVDKGTSRGERTGGEGYSGSTAWHNSVRSRLYLSRDKDGDALLLEHQKCNLGPRRDTLRLTWPPDGLPMLDQPPAGVVGSIARDKDTKALLRLIHEFTERGEFVSTATTSRTHAGKLLRPAPGFPPRLPDPDVFELLRAAERRGWLDRVEHRGADRKPRERWGVTAAGLEAAGVRQPAATAATCGDFSDSPSHRSAASPVQAPAATAATSPLGGVGGNAPHLPAAPATLEAAR